MAVALATLPSNSRLAGGGETFFATAIGAGLPDDFAADFAGAFAGLAAGTFLTAAFTAGFAAGLTTALSCCLLSLGADFFGTALATGDLLTLTFFTDTFLGAATFFGVAAFLATIAFFGTVFFGAAFFAATFFAAGFLAGRAFLPSGFATALESADFFFDFTAVAGLGGVFFAADLATVRPAMAGVLLAFFTTFPFAAVVFDAAALTPFALFEALSLCALALELPVVFAISLHRGWPWRPGVIAHVSFTSKPDSGILVTLHPPEPFRQRESSDQIDTVVAPFVQALDQSIAWPPVPLPPQLLRLCTDCGHPLWSLARQPARRLAATSLPALVHRRPGPGTGTLPLPPLSLRKRRR